MRYFVPILFFCCPVHAQERAAVVPLGDLGLVDASLHGESPASIWDSETASDAAGAVLGELGKWMSGANKGPAADPATHCVAGLSFSPLRPPDLKEVSLGQFRVRRSAGSELISKGLEPFAEALATALPGAATSPGAWIKFKITGIKTGAREWRTRAICQGAVHSATGHLQMESTWDCTWQPRGTEPPLLTSVKVTGYEETHLQSSAPAFADCTQSMLRGVTAWREQLCRDTDYWSERIEQRFFTDSSGWQGVSLGDVNGDGLDDLYLPQSGGLPNLLLLHQPDGTLRDFTAESGTGWWDHSNAAIFADFDEDGDQDLAIGLLFGVVFMQNDGKGHFAVSASVLTPEAQPYSLAAADYDNDGDLDLYAACYSPRAVQVANRFLARPLPYQDAKNGGRNVLLRNDRTWKFKNVTKAVGMDVNNHRFSLACAWEDFDNDGDQDLHVANDFGRDNFYLNEGPDADGHWHFRDAAKELGVDDIGAGMSVSWGDVDQDGFMDLQVSNMWSSAGHRVTSQARFQPEAGAGLRADFQHHARGNSLFHNNAGKGFTDISAAAGISLGRWAWGSVFLDINNDSWQDIYVANGYFTRPDPGDL